ncbi:hypothetical protein CLAIMM_13795 [Cladophialophora immunda]|nr:hypothetical protein CLAIMM_13795 [Cladophialophora immunda]
MAQANIAAWYSAPGSGADDIAREAYEDTVKYFEEEFTRDGKKPDWIRAQTSLGDVLDTVRKAQELYTATHKATATRRYVAALSTRVQNFGNVLDVLAQHHPEYVSLAWGAMRFLFNGVLNQPELVTELSRALVDIADVLLHVQLATNLYPTIYMNEAISRLYAHIMLFLKQVAKWYSMSPARRAISTLAKPYKINYKYTIEQIQQCSHMVDLAASAAARAELRDQNIALREQVHELQERDKDLKELQERLRSLGHFANASENKFLKLQDVSTGIPTTSAAGNDFTPVLPENFPQAPSRTALVAADLLQTAPQARSNTAIGSGSVAATTFNDSGYDSYGSSNRRSSEKAVEADTMTIATDSQSLHIPESTKEHLIVALVEELLDSITTEDHGIVLTPTQIEEICSLLKECSIEMGHYASGKLELDTLTFIRQQRRRIAQSLEKYLNSTQQEHESESEDEINDEVISLSEKMRLWRTNEKVNTEGTIEEVAAADFCELEDEPPIPELPYARVFLTTHPFYPQLIFRLKAILKNKVCEGDRSSHIRHAILRGLSAPGPPASRPHSMATRSAHFKFPAPSQSFLANDALFKDGNSLADVVVLQGGLDNAFATTCAEYVRMTWGQSGVDVFDKIQEAIHSDGKASWIVIRQPGRETLVSFEVSNGSDDSSSDQEYLNAVVIGSPLVMAVLGEQLAWLSSAFLDLEGSNALLIRKPEVLIETSHTRWDLTLQIDSENARQLDRLSSTTKPQCWHDLLRRFNLVEGFPIRPRKITQKGLEVPLDMMAFLAETCRATIFDARMVLKGWSTSLTPTAQVDDSILWHYTQEQNGNHLSHFLGWCDASEVLAGTSSAKYDEIDYSGAAFCASGVAFEKMSIVGGQFLSGGASFVRGNRNTPLIVSSPRHYMEQIEWLSGKNFVLYDVGDRRAWLIDGALAVLHIMCTRLRLRPYRSGTECMLEKLRYAKCAEGHDAGYNALTDPTNMQLEVFRNEQPWEEKVESTTSSPIIERRTKITITRFADLVTQVWFVIEEMFAHQARLQTTPSVNLRFTSRERLEGYDFMDVARGESPLRPRFVILKSSGKGWVDLARSIGAIALLGYSFGDLIIPAEQAKALCHNWRRLPHGHDYLAASVSLIKQIRRRHSSRQPGPFQIAQDVYWHQHDKLFGACNCKARRWKDTCDRVQTLLPASVGVKRPPEDILDLRYQGGAVIFGRGKRCPYRWPKDPGKAPEERQLGEDSDVADEEPAAALMEEDSGLGSSISATASQSITSASASLSTSPPVQFATVDSPGPAGNDNPEPSTSDREMTVPPDGSQLTMSDQEDSTAPPRQDLVHAITIPPPVSLLQDAPVTLNGPVTATGPHGRTTEGPVLKSSRSRLLSRAKQLFSPLPSKTAKK